MAEISKIMKKLIIVILAVTLLCLANFENKVNAKVQNVVIQYFYVTGCSSCNEVKKVLENLDSIGIKIELNSYNTVKEQGQNLLERFFKAYRVEENQQKVPIIFVGDRYFSGKDAIEKQLISYLKSSQIPETLVLENENSGSFIHDRFSNLSGVGVFTVGIINGLTPCSLSMLLFLISLLIVKKINIFKMGMVYCIGKFITYFFLGTVFYGFLQESSINAYETALKYFMTFIAILFAVLNLRDFFYARREKYEGIKLQLPRKIRGWNHKWIKKITVLDNKYILLGFSFVLGILTSVGEFLCTGQIYLTTILYMVHSGLGFDIKAIVFFFLYNCGFIIPLLIIIFVIHKGKEFFDITELIRSNMHIIKLVNSILFILLGLLLFFG